MATPRVEIPEIVINSSGAPVSGASVQVNVHGGGAATVYTTETGGVSAANPVITDSAGRIEGWVPEGSYDLVVSGTGFTTYTQYFEGTKGSNSPGALMSTTGDILYCSSANNAARLGIGGSTTVLHGGTTPAYSAVVEADITLADNTTDDVSTSRHGFVPKAPNDTTKFLRGDASWAVPPAQTTYRKTTSKTVNTTTTKTDLLNGEITLAANDLSTNKALRLSAHGDWKQNSGGSAAAPRLVFDLGGTTILDTGAAPASSFANSATRYGWWIDVTVAETGASNTQSVSIRGGLHGGATGDAAAAATFATGEGGYFAFGAAGVASFEGWNSGAKDGTGTLALALSVINASASANYEVVLKDALVVIE